MEQGKVYRLSLVLIIVFVIIGTAMFLLTVLAFKKTAPFVSILMLIFSITIIANALHLWRKRKEGRGFYWDEEGVVIDLKGAKVLWSEIEDIQFRESTTVSFSKSTVVYTHYTHHEKIRARRKKWLPTEAHSIDWIVLEKPKEFHQNLMKVWEEKKLRTPK